MSPDYRAQFKIHVLLRPNDSKVLCMQYRYISCTCGIFSAAPVQRMDWGMYGTQMRSRFKSETLFSGTGMGLPSRGC